MIKQVYLFFLILILGLVILSGVALFSGDLINLEHFFGRDRSQASFFLKEFRFPRLLTAILSGSGLAICGMVMQTLFRNPLAGPHILGISAGSSFGVLLAVVVGGGVFSQFGLIGAAVIGALAVALLVLYFAARMHSYVKVLLIGVMLSALLSGLVTILQSLATAEELRTVTFWSMGSIQYVQFEDLYYFFVFYPVIIGIIIIHASHLDILLLDELSAKSLGLYVRRTRFILIACTALLVGLITAFCGPIAFVGLAVPNLSKLLFRTHKHSILILSNLLLGAIFMLFCDVIILQLESVIMIPLNAMTALVGAPFLIFMLIKKMAL